MLNQATLKFLRLLKKNNDRDWFAKNRDKYEEARVDFENFIDELIKAISKTDKRIAGLAAKDCVYRIYRDVRFSKNKDPYKTSFAASITHGGRKSGKAGFYVHVEPGGEWGSMLAGGMWMPEAPVLKAIRQEIQFNTKEFKKIIQQKDFIRWFEQLEDQKLKKVPKGFDKDDPEVELYKYTSYLVSYQLKEIDLTSSGLIKKAYDIYKAITPFNDFLNRSLH